MTFDEWIEQTKQGLREIAGEVADTGSELNHVKGKADNVRTEVKSWCSETLVAERGTGLIGKNADMASRIRRRLVELGHDVEIAISPDYLLGQAGIDMNHLFDPIDGGSHYRVEQRGAALIYTTSTRQCDVVVDGQECVSVPIRIVALGNEQNRSICFNLGAINRPTGAFGVALTRNPSVCEDAQAALANEIESRTMLAIQPHLASTAVTPPQIDLLPPIQYRSGWADQLFRSFGYYSGRRRRRVNLLQGVPQGFGLAVKFPQDVIWQRIASEATRRGGTILGGPYVTGQRTFVVDIGRYETGSVGAACNIVNWSIKVWVRIAFEFTVRGGALLVVAGRQQGDPKVEIHLNPFLLQWLYDALKDKVDNFIKDQIPDFGTIQESIFFRGVRSMDAQLWDEFIMLSINPMEAAQ